MSRDLLVEASELALDRIWIEWKKWALRGRKPSLGLTFLRDSQWLSLYPELQSLIGVEQDRQWHPEGDVWTHTLHVCDAAEEVATREQLADQDRIVLLLACCATTSGKQLIPRLKMAAGMPTDMKRVASRQLLRFWIGSVVPTPFVDPSYRLLRTIWPMQLIMSVADWFVD